MGPPPRACPNPFFAVPRVGSHGLERVEGRVPDVPDDDVPEHVLPRTPRLPGSGRPRAIPGRMGSPGGVRLVRTVGRRPGLLARKSRPRPRRPTRGDRPRPERVRRLARRRDCPGPRTTPPAPPPGSGIPDALASIG